MSRKKKSEAEFLHFFHYEALIFVQFIIYCGFLLGNYATKSAKLFSLLTKNLHNLAFSDK